MSSELEIPQMIDNFPQIMWFEADELVPIIVAMAGGTIFEVFTASMIAGFVLTSTYIKHKRDALPGSLHHIGYWWGLIQLNERFTNGLAREYEQ